MGRARDVVLLLAVIVQGTAACVPVNVTACQLAAQTARATCQLAPEKVSCCMGPANLETCMLVYAMGCEPALVSAVKLQLDQYRQFLSTDLGFECSEGMGTPTTTVNLLFGASGSESGPRSALSSSPSGSMLWQWIIIGIFFCICLGGAGAGGVAMMGNMKKKGRGKKGGRAFDEEASAPLPLESEGEMPQQEFQQEMMQAPLVEETPFIVEEPPPMMNAEVEPLLFGDMPGLLPGPTASTIVTGGYPQSYSYGQVGVPQMASQYSAGYYQGGQPVAGSYYQAAAPAYNFAQPALGTQQYYAGGGAPVYATTAYAGQNVV